MFMAPFTRGVRMRGVDVLTAEEDGSRELPDNQLLQRATELARILFSQDRDLIREARLLQTRGLPLAGVVYSVAWHSCRKSARCGTAEEVAMRMPTASHAQGRASNTQ